MVLLKPALGIRASRRAPDSSTPTPTPYRPILYFFYRPWRSAQTVAPIAVGGVGLLSFAVYNRYVSKQPFIRPSLLSSATAKAAYFGALVHGVLVYSVLYYMPIYFQAVQEYSLLQSGAALLPYSLTTGFFAIGVGWAISKTGTYRLYVGAGWAVTTLGMGILLYLKHETSVPVWILIDDVGGVGFGIVWSAGSFVAQAAAADSDLLFAAAFFAFVRSVGQTLGVALGGVLFQNTFQRNIERNPLYAPYARRWAQDASALVGAVKDLTAPQDQALKSFMVAAYVDSLRVVWAVLCGLSALALVVNAVWVRDMTLDRKAEHSPNPVRPASPPLPRHIPSHDSEDGFKAVKCWI
ncbi:MFS general substrate transporter [Hypoxylon rubiginosum]|uniref:MFS general substrate transporter n=1 Tax=Hypoxylon rubiginosum TaxID=110542 RepID=A0ACC0CPU4_9PEZI|nr:MFS general substrate transporter [Hypoxylon rubiginosum]